MTATRLAGAASFLAACLAVGPAAYAQVSLTSTTVEPRPFRVDLDDPMLAPPPPLPNPIATWEEAHRILRARSTDLDIAQAELRRAEGLWRQSLSALLPNAGASLSVAVDVLDPDRPAFGGGLGAVGAVGGGGVSGPGGPTAPLGIASVNLSQAVLDLSAWRRLSSAGATERSVAADLRETQRRTTQALARSLIAVVAAERASEINRSNLRQALERAALTQRTFELGAATRLDVVRVRQDIAVARSALIAGDENLRRTREALGLVLGIPEQVGVAPTFTLETLIDETRQRCRPLHEGEDRSDVIAAGERVKAAEALRSSATAGYLPSLDLTSNLFAFTTDPGFARVATWNVAAVISFPLWEGGFREGRVAELEAVERQAADASLATERSVRIETTRARRAEDVAKALMAAATDARDLAATTDEMTRRSFQIGRATSLELVQSAAVLRQAELNLVLREFEWVQARLDAFLTEARCEG